MRAFRLAFGRAFFIPLFSSRQCQAGRHHHDMTDAANRSATCEGKQAFETYAQAEAVKGKKRIHTRYAKAIYHCTYCHKFHIGTPKRIPRTKVDPCPT